jgi:hypothetical protein
MPAVRQIDPVHTPSVATDHLKVMRTTCRKRVEFLAFSPRVADYLDPGHSG